MKIYKSNINRVTKRKRIEKNIKTREKSRIMNTNNNNDKNKIAIIINI